MDNQGAALAITEDQWAEAQEHFNVALRHYHALIQHRSLLGAKTRRVAEIANCEEVVKRCAAGERTRDLYLAMLACSRELYDAMLRMQ